MDMSSSTFNIYMIVVLNKVNRKVMKKDRVLKNSGETCSWKEMNFLESLHVSALLRFRRKLKKVSGRYMLE